MSSNPAPAKSYDEIVRRTVPEPDSSWRSTPAQDRDTRLGIRAQDDQERDLEARVAAALHGIAGLANVDIRVEVEHGRVVLLGTVPDPRVFRVVDDAVAAVEGVETIHNQLVVQPR
jgi:osmotically-inducible protein OsmY